MGSLVSTGRTVTKGKTCPSSDGACVPAAALPVPITVARRCCSRRFQCISSGVNAGRGMVRANATNKAAGDSGMRSAARVSVRKLLVGYFLGKQEVQGLQCVSQSELFV